MLTEIKQSWCSALRSGAFKQGQDRLVTKDEFGNDNYCCLGVLTYVYCATHNIEGEEKEILLKGIYLKDEVIKWAELDHYNPRVLDKDSGKRIGLGNINDGGTGFNKIADLIEAQL